MAESIEYTVKSTKIMYVVQRLQKTNVFWSKKSIDQRNKNLVRENMKTDFSYRNVAY